MNLVYANGLLIVMVLIELILIVFYKKEAVPWREIVFNLNSGHILMWILRGLEVSGFYFVFTHWSLHLLNNWNAIAIWIFAFISWDFCFYWLHRLHHKLTLLWAVHVVHHEGEHFSLSLGIRNSWYSSLTSLPFFVGLAIIGVPVEVFIAVSSLHYFVQFYNHNHLVNKSGFLEKIMITPSHHRVHHGKNDLYIDKNFGGTLIIWDKLFGTFQKEEDSIPVIFGTKNYQTNYEIIKANNLPFTNLIVRGSTIPQKAPEAKPVQVHPFFIFTAGILLFAALLFFISIENEYSANAKLALFSIVFIGTFATGGFSENKKWGVALWMLTFFIGTSLFVFVLNIRDAILISLFLAFAFHALSMFIYILSNTNSTKN